MVAISLNGRERPDRIRVLADTAALRAILRDLLPPGSVVLTPDEVEKVRQLVGWHQARVFTGTSVYELGREALRLLGGDQ